jgi:hypothetical protein
MHLNMSVGQSYPYQQNASSQSIPHPAPEVRPRHVSRRASRVDGLESVGIIFGNVGTLMFNCGVTSPLEKMEYIQVDHEIVGFVLGQVSEIERKTNLTIDGVEEMKNGTAIPFEEKEVAVVSVVGYRDDRNLLQVPRTPLKAGSVVYRAS